MWDVYRSSPAAPLVMNKTSKCSKLRRSSKTEFDEVLSLQTMENRMRSELSQIGVQVIHSGLIVSIRKNVLISKITFNELSPTLAFSVVTSSKKSPWRERRLSPAVGPLQQTHLSII